MDTALGQVVPGVKRTIDQFGPRGGAGTLLEQLTGAGVLADRLHTDAMKRLTPDGAATCALDLIAQQHPRERRPQVAFGT